MFFFSKMSRANKNKIATAIARAENATDGEIRVHLSYHKVEPDLIAAAKAKFGHLKMHETKLRNGVLLYVNPRLKQFALFGDEGIHEKVKQEYWDQLAERVTRSIKEKDLVHGIIHAIDNIGEVLKMHFPSTGKNANELRNDVSES